MWLDLEVPRAYFIDDITDHRLFVSALPLLLDPSDTVVFSTYGSRSDVVRFFVEHELPPDEFVIHERRRAACWHEANTGEAALDEVAKISAWAVRAEPTILSRLAQLFDAPSDAIDLCDHVAAYNGQLPIFIFHDAFKSDPLYITTRIAEDRVAAFSRALNKQYCVRVFLQTQIAPETKAAIDQLQIGMSEAEVIALMKPVTWGWFETEAEMPEYRELFFKVSSVRDFYVEIDGDGRISRIIGLYPP